MKPLVVLTLLVAGLAGCGGGTERTVSDVPDSSGDTTSSSGDTNSGEGAELPQLMAVALKHLVSEDHTFGQGPPPFTEYLIQTRLDPAAGSGHPSEDELRRLTDAEQAAIEDAIAAFGPVRWIDDPDAWRTEDLEPTVDGAVILGVGQPEVEDETALVPISLWCGGLCGTWFTYRLDSTNGAWHVTGTEGPVSVA